MSRCSCGSVTPRFSASTAPSTVSAFPESAPGIASSSWGAPRRPPIPPRARGAPAKPWHPRYSDRFLLGRLRHRRRVGLDVAAPPTRPQLEARVEALDGGLEVLLDVADVHRDLVQLRVALRAEPDEGLRLPGLALDLDDETPRVGRAGRRRRREGRHQQEPALADDLGRASALLHVFQDHVALEHVEDLVGGIDVEVSARIRAADDHRRELRVFPDDLVADRWLEGMAVVLDPPPEVEC